MNIDFYKVSLLKILDKQRDKDYYKQAFRNKCLFSSVGRAFGC